MNALVPSEGYEFGLRTEFGKTFNATIAVFRLFFTTGTLSLIGEFSLGRRSQRNFAPRRINRNRRCGIE